MDTIDVTGPYVVGPDDDLQIDAGVGFDMHQVDGGDEPSLDIYGSVTVAPASGGVTGVQNTTTTAPIAITTHAGSELRFVSGDSGVYGIETFSPTTLVNGGSLIAEAKFPAFCVYASGGGFDFTNTGLVDAQSPTWDAVAFMISGDAVMSNSGVISAEGTVAEGIQQQDGPLNFTNTGSMTCEGVNWAVAISVSGSGGFIDNEGRISCEASVNTFFAYGVDIAAGDDIRIDNAGTIEAKYAVNEETGAKSEVTIDNSGRMAGAVRLRAGDDSVANSGVITGSVSLGGGDDVFTGLGHGHVNGEVLGGKGSDRLTGGAGDDTLLGEKGLDRLTGGHGADVLTGGNDHNVFDYRALSDSTSARSDLITDLNDGDRIDLHKIDADAVQAGNQAFVLAASLDGHAGELALSYDAASDTTFIQGDVDGDGVADLLIGASGDHADFTGFKL